MVINLIQKLIDNYVYNMKECDVKSFALKNGINKYIVLDCRDSNLNWMKERIVQSKLNNIFEGRLFNE